MSKGRKGRTSPPRGARRGMLPRWAPWAGIAAVAGLVLLALVLRSTTAAAPSTAAANDVIAGVTGVSAAAFDTVGVPADVVAPHALPEETPPIEAGGKPLVLYVGAEYCPYCAAERWPLAVALSRFGTFSNLGQTESAGLPEAYPHTPTLSFHGSSYTGPLIAFQGVETATNQLGITGYGALDTPTPAQQRLFTTYDAPPYVQTATAIPFVLIGNRYVFNGAQYLPDVLHGHTAAQIATALYDPTTAIAQAVDGSANLLTAAICTLTDQEPTSVCSGHAVTAAAARLTE
jgi:Domain of unknown function (DUF929)